MRDRDIVEFLVDFDHYGHVAKAVSHGLARSV